MRIGILLPTLALISIYNLHHHARAQQSTCDVFIREGLYSHLREVSGSASSAHMRQAFSEALSTFNKKSVGGRAAVSFGPFSAGGSYSKDEISAVSKFLESDFADSKEIQANLERVRTYVPPEAYMAAQECWRLEREKDLRTTITWGEEGVEFSLSMTYVAAGSPNPSTPITGISFEPTSGLRCEGTLKAGEHLTPVSRYLRCYRTMGKPLANGSGRMVRARSALLTVATGVGSLIVHIPEIPMARLPADPLPLGTVIDWFPTPGVPIPRGYHPADGSIIDDPHSPLRGTAAPNLTDRFVMGVPMSRLGERGGTASIPDDGKHSHGGRTGPLAYHPGEINWNSVKGKQSQFSHRHSITEDGGHNHGGENRPPYFGLIKLIKIYPSEPPLAE